MGYFLLAAPRFSLIVTHARIIFLSAAEAPRLRWLRLDPRPSIWKTYRQSALAPSRGSRFSLSH
jgi:hypothetical protein